VKPVARQLTVQFYAIEPGVPETFKPANYPLDNVLASIGQSDPATEEYRIKEDLFGGETFCLLHEDQRFPFLGGYYKDLLSMPLTEMKGQVEKLTLRDGEGIVDATYAAFFDHDVVGIVRTSVKAPGHVRIGSWLSINGRPAMYLVPLPETDILGILNRADGQIKRFLLKIRTKDIPKIKEFSPSVYKALKAASEPSPKSDDVKLEWHCNKSGRAAFSKDMTDHIRELFSVYPDFMSARVEIVGEKPIDLKRSVIATKSTVVLTDSKKVGPSHAADALAEAYGREQASIERSVKAWRAGR
jgi:hypothetical protein